MGKLDLPGREKPQAPSLSDEKLSLEIAKLHEELEKLRSERELTRDKMQLEIRHLQRSDWRKPGTIVPITATVLAIAFAGIQGAFKTAYDLVQIREAEANLRHRQLDEKQADQETRMKDLADKDKQLANQTARQEALAKNLDAQQKALAADTLAYQTQRMEVEAKLKTVADLQSQLDASYPAFRGSFVQQFIVEAHRSCAQVRITKPAAAIFPDTPKCLNDLLAASQNAKTLSAEDKSKLLRSIASVGKNIAEGQAEAKLAFDSRDYVSRIPSYAKINKEFNGELSAEQEEVRKSRILQSYNSVVEGTVWRLAAFLAGQEPNTLGLHRTR